MKAIATFAVTAVLMMVMGVLAVPAQAAAEVVALDDQIETEDGATEVLGGGDHFFVKFGTDAAFGIVWGTEDNENAVYFVTIKARYLGLAQVYNMDGEMIEENATVKVYTMYAVKLDSMLEFNDSDDDGLVNYTRTYEDGKFLDYAYEETAYKKVDLNTSWDASEVIETGTEESRAWDFSLTATDLPYELVDESAEADTGDDMLNELTLTFHLTADLAQYDNVSLPQWRVTVTSGPLGKMLFMSAERLEPLQAEGKIMKYDVKWDQEIQGWDYDPNNTNPAVLIEFHSLVGNFVSPLMATWMEMKMLTYTNQVGVMNCASVEGELEVNETTGDLIRPRQLTQTRLTFGTDLTDIGQLTWVDSVTVDGEPELVKVQIMAGHRVMAWAKVAGELQVFTGFVALGAMVFPGGDSIIHDPVYSSEALVDVNADTTTKLPVFLLLVGAVVIVLIVVAIAAVSSSGKKPGRGDRGSYERSKGSQPGDWSKYYNKK
ncbi:MAG: hypothetical protein AB1793_05980 [Candidatus Thermoplasmatota archaeon]